MNEGEIEAGKEPPNVGNSDKMRNKNQLQIDEKLTDMSFDEYDYDFEKSKWLISYPPNKLFITLNFAICIQKIN